MQKSTFVRFPLSSPTFRDIIYQNPLVSQSS
uniref:Uncharacterized protein n=1 Tax=Siphoviridae sp. ctL0q1 TaxID=2825449 RepID=A0A8S5PKG7_9CAUD|nr:MAG TPA: hypothetical protein [Siphoviridae sp. ctL0q1]